MQVPSPRRWALALAAWSTFVWANRINNLRNDATVTPRDELLSLAMSVTSLVLAAVTVVLVGRAWRRGWPAEGSAERAVLLGFAVWTTGVWAVRIVGIVVDWRSAAFVAVHVVLALVSIALASGLWRSLRPDELSLPIERVTERIGDR